MPLHFARYRKKLTKKFPYDPVAILGCDSALKYVADDMQLYCEGAGIEIDSSCPSSSKLKWGS